jgi:hypothetical protein
LYDHFMSLWNVFCHHSSHTLLFSRSGGHRHLPPGCELSIHWPASIVIQIWTFYSKSNPTFQSIAIAQIPKGRWIPVWQSFSLNLSGVLVTIHFATHTIITAQIARFPPRPSLMTQSWVRIP